MEDTMNRRSFLLRPLSNSTSNASHNSTPLNLAGLEEYSGAWTYTDAAHLLRRATFGAKKSDVMSLLAKTPSQAVDMLLSPPAANTPPAPINYVGDGMEWTSAEYNTDQINNQRLTFLQSWFFSVMINQPISINEKMTLFWMNHFSCGANAVKDSRYMFKQNQMLRINALGNFRTLVKNITLDPAMLRYLNGTSNKKSAPNENYARELQELFTIGKGPEISPGNYTNYTESDIKAAAKVLTGWSDDTTNISYKFSNEDHDISNKQFSTAYGNTIITGKTGQAGATQEIDALITMILDQQATAKYIVSKIYRWFVSTEISEWIDTNIITPLANSLKQNNYEIKPVLSQLLKSSHFFDQAFRGAMVKSPIDLGIGILRSLTVDAWRDYPGAPSELAEFLPVNNNSLHWSLRPYRRTLATMQQDLFNPPNVAGLPAYYQIPQFDQIWINADTLQKRIKLIDDFIVIGYKWDEAYGHYIANVIEYAKLTSAPGNASILLNEWIVMNFPFALTDAQKAEARTFFLGALTDNDWTSMWNDYAAAPTNEDKKLAVETRLRALLRHLLGLAEYQLM
jgi:uncharacterized protein (DUF1800 family)